jgi:AP-4 complex subunit epsilon-1
MDHPKGPKSLPAAFVQVKLLKLLGLLAKGDEQAARQVVGVVGDCLKAADNGTNMGHAIIAEAVKTVALLPPNSGLLQPAADAVARFLRAKSHNLKYVGIDVLCDIVAVSHAVAAQHQWAVIECLEDADETLRRKTLDLLYAMCGPHNVEVIAGRMLGYIRHGGADESSCELTCSRVASLAERFAPSNEWFITTMNAVFELGGDLVKPHLAHDLIRLIAEGAGVQGPGAAEADAALRGSACGAYWEVLLRPRVPVQLLCIALWVLGEYGVASRVAADGEELQERIVAAVDAYAGTHGEGVTQVTRYALSALSKIVAQHGCPLSRGAVAVATQASRSRVTDLAQRAAELQALAAAPRPLAACAVPFDASAKNLAALDPDLRFLDGYVAQALARGASPYQPAEARTTLANPISQAEAAAASASARARHSGNGAATPQQAPRGGDEMDVFGLGVGASPSTFRSPPPQASPGPVYATPLQAQAQTPREEAAPVVLNVSGARKWGPHVTLAANPPPTPSAASPAAQRGSELDMLEAFAGLNTGGAGPSASAQTPQRSGSAPLAASTPPPQAVNRQAAAPPVDPAKAKLAAALFAGGSSSSGAGPSGVASSPAPAFAGRHAARQQQQQTQQQQGPDSVDLLGQLASPPHVAAKPAVSSSHDLLNQLAGPSNMAVPPIIPFGMPMAAMPQAPAVAAQPADPFASLAAAMPAAGAPHPMAWMQPQGGMGMPSTPPLAIQRSPAPAMPQMMAGPPAPGMYQSPAVRAPQGPLDTRVLDQLLAGAPPPRTPLPAVFSSQPPTPTPTKPDPFSNLLS